MSAILAKALNSTMGTDNFLSFDQLMAREKSIVASNNMLFDVPHAANMRLDYSQSGTVATTEKEVMTMRMRATGSFTIKGSYIAYDDCVTSSVGINTGIRVYKGDEIIAYCSCTSLLSSGGQAEYVSNDVSFNVPCFAGDFLSIRLYCTGNSYAKKETFTGYGIIKSLYFYGTINDCAYDIALGK